MPGPRVRSFAALPCTLPNPHHVSGTLSNPRKKEAKQRGKEHFRMINTFDYRHTRGRSRSFSFLLASAVSLFIFAFFFRRCRISEVEQQHSQHRGERNVFLPLLRLAFSPSPRRSSFALEQKAILCLCLGCGNGFCFEESEKHLHNHNSKYFDLKKQHFRTNTAARTSPRHHHDRERCFGSDRRGRRRQN
jgi:hypothetical protein